MTGFRILAVGLTALAGCASLPPPTPENNIETCRELARIERSNSSTLTEQVDAKLDSRQIGCPRFAAT